MTFLEKKGEPKEEVQPPEGEGKKKPVLNQKKHLWVLEKKCHY